MANAVQLEVSRLVREVSIVVRKSQTPRRKPKPPPCPSDRLDLEVLAAEQGVQPIGNPSDLVAAFWPADESADDFVQAVRQWRKEGQRRPAP